MDQEAGSGADRSMDSVTKYRIIVTILLGAILVTSVLGVIATKDNCTVDTQDVDNGELQDILDKINQNGGEIHSASTGRSVTTDTEFVIVGDFVAVKNKSTGHYSVYFPISEITSLIVKSQ